MLPPGPNTSDEDLLRYGEFLEEGWAFATTSRRAPGFGVMRAAEDTENARRAAIAVLGHPRITVLHGQSWGAAVAAKAIETINAPGPDGRRPWDAALLTAGVLAGPTRAYDMRVDLLAAYAVLCGDASVPAQFEPAPPAAPPVREEVIQRYRACTGANLTPEARSPAQRRALAALAAASRIPDWAIAGHLWWATRVLADITHNLTGGRSAFGNEAVRYAGTFEDAEFNARVPRIHSDPAAEARLAADGDLSGRVEIPVLTLHGIADPTVFVENEAAYRATREAAGTADLLFQVFVDEGDHQKLSAALYPTALVLLARWAETGARPTTAAFRTRCQAMRSAYGGECRILPDYVPEAWDARINPRRPLSAIAGRR
jgi:fermentation-respiration switch protein FrsA (DUF1100 family)